MMTSMPGIGLQRLQVVQNVDRFSRQAHEFRVGTFARPLAAVHVSTDGGDRRDPAKRVDDVTAPDVAGMDDVIDTHQASFRVGPQQLIVSEIIPILNVIRCCSRPPSPKDDREALPERTASWSSRVRYRTIPPGRLRESSAVDRSGAAIRYQGIADQRRRIKMALTGECDNPLASALSHLPQRPEWTN
jgi:hypothetical protein